MKHITFFQWQDYLDGLVSPTQAQNMEMHLRYCQDCQGKLKSLRILERSLRRVEFDRVSPDFTQRVMKRLRLTESPMFVWGLLKNVGPALALISVISILFLVFKNVGTFESLGVGDTLQLSHTVYENVSSALVRGIETFNLWIHQFFPFAFTSSGYGMIIFLIIFFCLIGIIDKFLLLPLVRKRS